MHPSGAACLFSFIDLQGPKRCNKVEHTPPTNMSLGYLYQRDPSLPADRSPGSLPAESDRDWMIGKNTPPALAVVLGIAGAIKASLMVSPYDSPNVLFPSHFTK
ncbi:hypothetical protein MUK42_32694 [Musa troglodytarum]|uniref:Uncharacterized protein n=1 Tax=Musa troglodytarum TaxID=320322 RepID=A0A9E7LCP6_9LILI|nr:hypothetical protein MUK42_32694 [Musa troglodytarum]